MHWSRWFPGEPESVAEARRFTRTVLRGWVEQDTAETIVSEVATNAIRHSASGEPGGYFVVEIAGDDDEIHLRVYDLGGPKSPSEIEPADEQEGGRGLFIVACLATAWGVDGDGSAGRTVWANIASSARP